MLSLLGQKTVPSYKELGFTGVDVRGTECFIDDEGDPILPYWSIGTKKPDGNILRVDVEFYNAATED